MRKSNLSPREELLKIQRQIFLQNKKRIEDSVFVREKSFETYQKNYFKRLKNYQKVVDIETLESALQKAQLIYVGDYHTNKQSQRTFLRLLKRLKKKKASFVIALELLHARYQKQIEAYLQDKISEELFLKQIQLKKRWYIDLWPHFAPLFHFAKHHQVSLYAIEAAPENSSLRQRDEEMAGQLLKIHRQYPKQKILVLVGDLHLAPEHLPHEFEKLLSAEEKPLETLSIYQNSADIYWKLAEQKKEEKIEVVQLDERSFCMLNTPPIVWQQSYLNWLEQEGDEIEFVDARSQVLSLAGRIARFLGLKLSSAKDDLEVYTCGDLSFLERLKKEEDFSAKEITQIKQQILASESYTIPRKKIIYLGSLSLNHAAEEAAHFLKYLCSGEEFERDSADAFYANILHETLGFFGSKIINHKRKCMQGGDYKKLIQYLRKLGGNIPRERQLELEIARLILQHIQLEKKDLTISEHSLFKKHLLFFGVTHGLGYRLGDKLYYAMMQGKISKSQIRELFVDPFRHSGQAAEVYRWLIRKVEGVKLPKRV
ncbi:MAG: ChaN family lipoprotein [Deltaproteobacteria bacterium]|nr:ChaN family lipoprotein [Deltaproteobacteria bacterium]